MRDTKSAKLVVHGAAGHVAILGHSSFLQNYFTD